MPGSTDNRLEALRHRWFLQERDLFSGSKWQPPKSCLVEGGRGFRFVLTVLQCLDTIAACQACCYSVFNTLHVLCWEPSTVISFKQQKAGSGKPNLRFLSLFLVCSQHNYGHRKIFGRGESWSLIYRVWDRGLSSGPSFLSCPGRWQLDQKMKILQWELAGSLHSYSPATLT